jgi:hypothetical protein
MAKTMDEYFEAAEVLINELLGEDGTPAEIGELISERCEDWSKEDRENAAVLASRVAKHVCAWIQSTSNRPDGWTMRDVHLGHLTERINIYLGRQQEYTDPGLIEFVENQRKRWPYDEGAYDEDEYDEEEQVSRTGLWRV